MVKLTQGQADKIDNNSPINQLYSVGERAKQHDDYDMVVLKLTVGADATGALSFTMPSFNIEIVDIVAQCTASNASGTLTLRRVTTAISSAIVCAVGDVISRSTDVVQAAKNIVASEVLNVIANGAADRGIVYITGFRRT